MVTKTLKEAGKYKSLAFRFVKWKIDSNNNQGDGKKLNSVRTIPRVACSDNDSSFRSAIEAAITSRLEGRARNLSHCLSKGLVVPKGMSMNKLFQFFSLNVSFLVV